MALIVLVLIGWSLGWTTTNVTSQLPPPPKHIYYVAPSGSDVQTGARRDQPLASIQKALSLAQPGDAVQLADGRYLQSIKTVRSGTKRAPIVIMGSRNAIVQGDSGRIIEINHDYITLYGFQVDGKWDDPEIKDSYRDKLIYAIGMQPKSGVKGLKISNMLLQNAGGECVRLRYFAVENEVRDSIIRNCGRYDFAFADGGKNGEGIYIGTAPEQRKDGKNPTDDPDISTKNHIHHNLIETYGNECVDIKEAAVDNLVEHNTCRQQLDTESGGFDARGDRNTFRYNTVEDTRGAAVRLGGDNATDGVDNNVYGNTFRRNQAGSLNIQRMPQGDICENNVDKSDKLSADDFNLDVTRRCR